MSRGRTCSGHGSRCCVECRRAARARRNEQRRLTRFQAGGSKLRRLAWVLVFMISPPAIAWTMANRLRSKWRGSNVDRNRNRTLRRFGITPDDYLRMFEEQAGLCSICHRPELGRANTGGSLRRLAVDHDHATGAVRSLLCGRCNMLIGALEKAESDPKFRAYLDKHAAAKVGP